MHICAKLMDSLVIHTHVHIYVYMHMRVTRILHRDNEFEKGEEWLAKRRKRKQRQAIGGGCSLARLTEAVSSGFSSQDTSGKIWCSLDKGIWKLTIQRSRRVQVRKCFSASASLHFSVELWVLVHLLGFHNTVNKPLSILCAGLLSTQNSVLLLLVFSSIKHPSSRQMH